MADAGAFTAYRTTCSGVTRLTFWRPRTEKEDASARFDRGRSRRDWRHAIPRWQVGLTTHPRGLTRASYHDNAG